MVRLPSSRDLAHDFPPCDVTGENIWQARPSQDIAVIDFESAAVNQDFAAVAMHFDQTTGTFTMFGVAEQHPFPGSSLFFPGNMENRQRVFRRYTNLLGP
jgi:hypothetical protein